MNPITSSLPHHTNITSIYHPITKKHNPILSKLLLEPQKMGIDQQKSTPKGSKTLIFTYGTLKKGFSNHKLMEDLIERGEASYVGPCRTKEKYPLVCGPYRVPFLLNIPGQGDRVWGEVYMVSDKALTRLDELEGTTKGHYERLPIQLSELPETQSVEVGAVEAYYAHKSYAHKMWKRNGEEGFVSYTHKEAKGYVKRQDRPQNLTFLEHISMFLSSSN